MSDPLPVRTAIPPTLLRMIVNQFLPGWWTKGVDTWETREELGRLGKLIDEQRSRATREELRKEFALEFDLTCSEISQWLASQETSVMGRNRERKQLIRAIALCLTRLYMIA